MPRIVAAILVLAMVALLGCEPPPPSGPAAIPGQPVVDCRAPAETCQGAVNDATANVPPGAFTVRIQVVCKLACTPQRGEAEVSILYSDGSTQQYTMGWEGAQPQPMPVDPASGLPVEPICVGVPEVPCRDMAESAWQASIGAAGLPTITVTCDAVCDAVDGTGTTSIRWPDGTTEDSTFDYAGLDGEGIAP